MRKTAKSGDKATTKGPTEMDPSVTERAVGAPATNNQRACWAIKTLTQEVWDLFPETPVEYDKYNQRNTALAVVFDLSNLDEDSDRIDAANLLRLIEGDPRVLDVTVDSEGTPVYVEMHNNPRTQDSRAPFGLSDALLAMSEVDDYDEDEDDFAPIHRLLAGEDIEIEEGSA